MSSASGKATLFYLRCNGFLKMGVQSKGMLQEIGLHISHTLSLHLPARSYPVCVCVCVCVCVWVCGWVGVCVCVQKAIFAYLAGAR